MRRAGIDYRLFEAGPALLARRHDRADELGYGIGGAGLFSDGKFSYFHLEQGFTSSATHRGCARPIAPSPSC
ncbi:MAG: hypothetical protein MZV49_21820 [Rhodopseudomonas palustris]|nr:hypothetical protein [Rhodopseudomonas palustris]